MIDLGVIDGEIVRQAGGPLVVEDRRPGSGHMQVQHQAPCSGLFEAAVRLGGRVNRGDPLGDVADVLGRRIVPVACERSGIVLVLRSFARVAAGEGLAVVLETGQGGDRSPDGG